MAALAQDLLALALAVLLSLVQAAYGTQGDDLADGWHSWETAAGSSGRRACCFRVQNGNVGKEGCRLGPDTDGLSIDGDCDSTSDRLRVYVLVEDGKVTELRALSAACPVSTSTPARTLADKDARASIRWLERYARAGSGLADDAVTAIAMHDDASAFHALTALIEDPAGGRRVREQALFWLAQSGDEQAFRYLDELLTAR